MRNRRHEHLGRNSRIMIKIDNMETNDMDSREVYKPKNSNNYSLDSLYSEEFSQKPKEKSNVDLVSILSLLAIVIVLIIVVIVIIKLAVAL